MHTMTHIEANQRNGNLHINLSGKFTPETAHRLTTTMAEGYQGSGNIFIHTDSITEVDPTSRQILAEVMGMATLPLNNIYWIGTKGMDLGPDASKVIVHDKKKHEGCGRCKNCRCHERHFHAHDHAHTKHNQPQKP